jgi:hypothetical protein
MAPSVILLRSTTPHLVRMEILLECYKLVTRLNPLRDPSSLSCYGKMPVPGLPACRVEVASGPCLGLVKLAASSRWIRRNLRHLHWHSQCSGFMDRTQGALEMLSFDISVLENMPQSSWDPPGRPDPQSLRTQNLSGVALLQQPTRGEPASGG